MFTKLINKMHQQKIQDEQDEQGDEKKANKYL